MKVLVIFYSRTGNTKKVAQEISRQLNYISRSAKEPRHEVLIEEIFDTKNRNGVLGYLSAGKDGTQRNLTKLKPISHNPADFDLIIIGTPIWSWNMSAPVRTYLEKNKGNFKQVAFFCTMGGQGDDRAFKEMSGIINKTPIATFAVTAKEIIAGNYNEAVSGFINKINSSSI